MTTNVIQTEKRSDNWFIPLISAIAVTFFLFFIDEGYYNFNWTKDPGNWVAFAIYTIGLLIGEIITSLLILRKYKGEHKTLLTCVIGIPIGIALVISLFLALIP